MQQAVIQKLTAVIEQFQTTLRELRYGCCFCAFVLLRHSDKLLTSSQKHKNQVDLP